MFILNQDRDEIIECTLSELHVHTEIKDDVLWGFNLMHGDTMLGTYDTYEEAEEERQAILKYDKPYYVISGFDPTYIVD